MMEIQASRGASRVRALRFILLYSAFIGTYLIGASLFFYEVDKSAVIPVWQ